MLLLLLLLLCCAAAAAVGLDAVAVDPEGGLRRTVSGGGVTRSPAIGKNCGLSFSISQLF